MRDAIAYTDNGPGVILTFTSSRFGNDYYIQGGYFEGWYRQSSITIEAETCPACGKGAMLPYDPGTSGPSDSDSSTIQPDDETDQTPREAHCDVCDHTAPLDDATVVPHEPLLDALTENPLNPDIGPYDPLYSEGAADDDDSDNPFAKKDDDDDDDSDDDKDSDDDDDDSDKDDDDKDDDKDKDDDDDSDDDDSDDDDDSKKSSAFLKNALSDEGDASFLALGDLSLDPEYRARVTAADQATQQANSDLTSQSHAAAAAAHRAAGQIAPNETLRNAHVLISRWHERKAQKVSALSPAVAKAGKSVGEMSPEEYAAHQEQQKTNAIEGKAWNEGNKVDHRNIVNQYFKGTDDEHEQGKNWYSDAHNLASIIAKGTNTPMHTMAGLLSNYSPQTHWAANMQNAARVAKSKVGLGGKGSGILATDNQRKAADRMLANGGSEHYDDILSGPKTRAFAHLIEHGGNADDKNPRVVIDRHALSVATGARATDNAYAQSGLSGKKRYQEVSDAYVKAAKIISKRTGTTVHPHQVQAATWLTQQRLNAESDRSKSDTDSSRAASAAKTAESNWHAYAMENHPTAIHMAPGTGYRPDAPEDVKQAQDLNDEQHGLAAKQHGVKTVQSKKFDQYVAFLELDSMARESAWRDVRRKALRLRSEGRLSVDNYEPFKSITGTVRGDTGIYTTHVGTLGGTVDGSVSTYDCECPWGQHAYDRTTMVGRLCAHGLAMHYEMQSRNHASRRSSLQFLADGDEDEDLSNDDVSQHTDTGEAGDALNKVDPGAVDPNQDSDPDGGDEDPGTDDPEGADDSSQDADMHTSGFENDGQSDPYLNDSTDLSSEEIVANFQRDAEFLMTPTRDSNDIADAAEAFLRTQAGKSYSPSEQLALIEEPGNASNIADLDLSNTSYLLD